MTMQTMHGGWFDGHMMEVADHIHRVAFPLCTTSTGGVGRSLAELEPEIRFDPETGGIVTPHGLVLGYRMTYYRRTADGFVVESESA